MSIFCVLVINKNEHFVSYFIIKLNVVNAHSTNAVMIQQLRMKTVLRNQKVKS